MNPVLSDEDEIWSHLKQMTDEDTKSDTTNECIHDSEFKCNNCGHINTYQLNDGDFLCE